MKNSTRLLINFIILIGVLFVFALGLVEVVSFSTMLSAAIRADIQEAIQNDVLYLALFLLQTLITFALSSLLLYNICKLIFTRKNTGIKP